MVHMIVMILKFLGILLLTILGILVFLIVSVLFVPICYSGKGNKTKEKISGKATVSWMFHLLHGRILYEEQKTDIEVFLFGIPLLKLKKKIAEWKKKRRKKIKDKQPQKEAVIVEERQVEKSVVKENLEKIPEKEEATTQPEKKETAQVIEKVEKSKNIPRKDSLWKKIKNAISKIYHLPATILKKLEKIRLTFKGICDRIKQWRSFIKEETTKEAIRFLWLKGKKIIRHLLPRKMSGAITFGFEDPALTGQVLGWLAVFYPLYGKKFQVYPLFDEEILEGELCFSGRILLGYLLWTAWQIYRKNEVKMTYQRFQDKEA